MLMDIGECAIFFRVRSLWTSS